MYRYDRLWWTIMMVGIVLVGLPFLAFLALALGACTPSTGDIEPARAYDQADNNHGAAGHDQGGEGDGVVLHLPVPSGRRLKCTQGASGAHSHRLASTSHDLDFDTGNTRDEELFAPVSGVAHVHTENANKNFGYHVNIDLGDGTYVVVAHMKRIVINDGDEVSSGQFLGYEGCTGACTGDHVHVGRHSGNASRMAEFGSSVAASYFVQDSTSGQAVVLPSAEVVCGIRSLGDPVEGHVYTSVSPVPLWHPDGSLVKLANASAVYRLADGGLDAFASEEVMRSYGYSFDDVTIISLEEAACYERGADLTLPRTMEVVQTSDGQVWALVREPGHEPYRQKVYEGAVLEVLISWSVPGEVLLHPPIWNDTDSRFSSYALREGFLPFRPGTLVRESSNSAVFLVVYGAALPIDSWQTLTKLGFASHPILYVDDGVIAQVMSLVGMCGNDVYCLTQDSVETCGGFHEFQDLATQTQEESRSAIIPHAFSLAEGEFGIAYQPPSAILAEHMELQGEVFDGQGQRLLAWTTLSTHDGSGQLTWKTQDLHPGDGVSVRVTVTAPRATYLSCEDGDVVGTLFAGYGNTHLPAIPTVLSDGRCVHVVHVPFTRDPPQGEQSPPVNTTTLEEAMAANPHRFVVGYEPEHLGSFEEQTLYAEATDVRGAQIMGRTALQEVSGSEALVWGTSAIESGDTFYLEVLLTNVTETLSSCDGPSGRMVAMLDGEVLSTSVVYTRSGCRHVVPLPQDPPSVSSRVLHVDWHLADAAARLTLSGEHRYADGGMAFYWQELAEERGGSSIEYDLLDAHSGDTFRFSVEIERTNGSVTWSCLGPYPNFTLTGSAYARWGNEQVEVGVVPDPSGETTGCGLMIRIP